MNWKFKRANPSIIFLILIILLICVGDFLFFLKNGQFKDAALSIIVTYSLFLIPVILFRNYLRLYAWLLIPVILFVPVTLACIIFYNVPINDSIVLLALDSNVQEASELAKGFILPIVFLFIFCMVVYPILAGNVPVKIPFKNSAFISGLALMVLLTIPFVDSNGLGFFKKIRARLYTIYPSSLVYAGTRVYKQYQLMHATLPQRQSFSFNSKQHPAFQQKQVYILVVGESARYDHFGINGYYRNTTPKLSKQSNLISFTDTKASAFITAFSVPLILTGLGANDFDKHLSQTSIISAFKEAGFKTYWISNQVDNGHIKIHIGEAANQYLLMTDAKATQNLHTDSELLGVLDKVLKEPGDKKFIVYHSLGSHYDYSARYPGSYDFYQPSNKTEFTLANDYRKKNIIINSYDNSILYRDNVLDSIINLTANQQAVSAVYYISDHGENLFDDARNLSQHGYPVPSKYVAKVPFFIWYSDSLKKLQPRKIAQLQLRRNKKISAVNIFYTYLDMCDIVFEGNDSLKSLCQPKFKEVPRRILGGGTNVYDADLLE